MDEIISNALMSFGAAFTGAAFSKAQGPGQALDDIMTMVGFEKLHEVAERKRVKREYSVQKYKESLAQGIISIDEGNLQDPPLSIVGPALEASKYYIEEQELREMFSKLIITSMDKSKGMIAHPSFVEIIKQLSPLDANILKSFKNTTTHPVAKIISIRPNGYFELNDYFIVDELFDNQSIIDVTKSIANLDRLGLIKISEGIIENEEYFMEHPNVKTHLEMYKQESPVLKVNRLDVTSYGVGFINSCVRI